MEVVFIVDVLNFDSGKFEGSWIAWLKGNHSKFVSVDLLESFMFYINMFWENILLLYPLSYNFTGLLIRTAKYNFSLCAIEYCKNLFCQYVCICYFMYFV